MPAAAGGPDVFELQGRTVTRENGRLLLDDGTLAGSNLTMDEAVRYCVNQLDVSLEEALRMASLNPAAFMRRDHELGLIKPGYLASVVHLSDQLNVLQTWIDGK
jgi:N-acetylglucosamine-6-phosphate deacetylase